MNVLNDIKNPVNSDLKEFEFFFKEALKTKAPLLNQVLSYMLKRKGKQMRPLFVFLSAKLVGEINQSTHIAAALIELLHTSTLIHDDVVDEAYHRRGLFSINALWKNKISVLTGDFLLSKGMLLALENNEYKLLQIVSEAVKLMSEGELIQLEKSRKLDIDEETYYTIIKGKTASLIASCCSAGVASVSTDKSLIDKMNLFGEYTGIAFQIKDDLMDFGIDDTGKPKGTDLKEKKLTLPILHTLSKLSKEEQIRIKKIIKYNHKKPDKIKEVYKAIEYHNGFEYAQNQMKKYHKKALDILLEFPESEARKSLESLLDYTIIRKK